MYYITQQWKDIRIGFEWLKYDGTGRTGLSFSGAIQRQSDMKWLGEDGWQEEYVEQAMTEPDTTNLAGLYQLKIPPNYCGSGETSYLGKMVGDIVLEYDPTYTVHIEFFFCITVLQPANGRLQPL